MEVTVHKIGGEIIAVYLVSADETEFYAPLIFGSCDFPFYIPDSEWQSVFEHYETQDDAVSVEIIPEKQPRQLPSTYG